MTKRKKISKKKAITRDDVARAAGVSGTTVSYILNDTPGTRISNEKKDLVKSIALRMGYAPSLMAKATSTGKTGIIGVVLCNTTKLMNRYTSNVLSGIWSVAHKNNYKVAIDATDKTNNVSSFFRERIADGILLIAPPISIQGIDTLVENHFPTVSIGENISPEIDYIGLNNEQVANMQIDYLVRKGHKRIALLAGPTTQRNSAQSRLNGFKEGLKKHGIQFQPEYVLESEYHESSTQLTIENNIDLLSECTALTSSALPICQGAANAIYNAGLSIPNDISITSFSLKSDSPNELTIPHRSSDTLRKKILTQSWNEPLEEMGIKATERLLKRINGSKLKSRRIYIKPILSKGNSVSRLTKKSPSEKSH